MFFINDPRNFKILPYDIKFIIIWIILLSLRGEITFLDLLFDLYLLVLRAFFIDLQKAIVFTRTLLFHLKAEHVLFCLLLKQQSIRIPIVEFSRLQVGLTVKRNSS